MDQRSAGAGRSWWLVVAGVGLGCRPTDASSPEPPAAVAAVEASASCGAAPACEAPQQCVAYHPIADRPAPPVQTCEQPCSFAGDDCPAGQFCAMESAGAGLVCRPVPTVELPADIERVIALAEVWAAVRVSHPWLAYRDIDWGAALRQAIGPVRAADTDQAFRAAVDEMLAAIGDPATHVASPDAEEGPPPDLPLVRDEAGAVVVRLTSIRPYDRTQPQEVAERIAEAPRVIFDLRGWPTALVDPMEIAFAAWSPQLLGETVVLPSRRSRVWHGFAPEQGWTSGGYYQAFETAAAPRVEGKRTVSPPWVAFVVDAGQALPAIALPLWESGRGFVVAETRLDARAMATTTVLGTTVGGGTVHVRTSEVVDDGRRPTLSADLVAAQGDPITRAGALLRRKAKVAGTRAPRRRHAERSALPVAIASPRPPEPIADLPDLDTRMQVVIDLWSTLDRFQAYPDRRPRWDAALGRALVAMGKVTSREAYDRVLMELNASTDDGHSLLHSKTIFERLGGGHAPFDVAVIEGCAVVIEVFEPAAADGIEVGDIVMEVDGASFSGRYAELAPQLAAATPGHHRMRVAHHVFRGTPGQKATLAVDHDGTRREVTITWTDARPPEREAPKHWTVADGTIGVVDLMRLTPAEVPAMFEALGETDAIVFDLRGYPKGTAWTIAPYLDRHPGPTVAARIDRPRVVPPSPSSDLDDMRTSFLQRLPEGAVPHYDGVTVMLVDARTISQAEHTGLFFAAANGTRFVGTVSAGANGDVTNHWLPDGTTVMFTGQAITWPSGRPLQRVGLPLTVEVAPTIEGMRTGRDEVLEAAIELVRGK